MCEDNARTSRLRFVFSTAILLATAGCVVDDTPPPEPLEAFASDFTLEFCQSLETCCVDWNFSRNVCQSYMRWLDDAVSTARRDRFVYHEHQATKCLDDLRRADLCNEHVPSTCAGVFESLLGPGDACESALECPPDAGGYAGCELEADGARRCAGAAQLGERCAWTCDDGGFCSPSGDSPIGKSCYLRQGLQCASSGKCERLDLTGGIERLPSTSICDPNELDPCRGRSCSDAVCGQPASFICVVGLGSLE